jgi:hypothetical protein
MSVLNITQYSALSAQRSSRSAFGRRRKHQFVCGTSYIPCQGLYDVLQKRECTHLKTTKKRNQEARRTVIARPRT